MAIRPFQLHRPDSLEEALALLDEHGDDASPIAGGTELLVALKARVLHYEHLVDLKRVRSLRGVSLDAAGGIVIGALSTHHELANDPLIREHLPAYATLSDNVANIRVRAAGTVGGNLCFAEPHADPPALLCALGASVLLEGRGRSRRVRMEDFITSDFTTEREDGELLTRIEVPRPASDRTFAYANVGHLERPAVGVAVGCRPHGGGYSYDVWVGAIAGRPVRLAAVEQALAHAPRADAATIARRTAEQAASELEAHDDIHGSADYKRHLAAVLVGRMVDQATRGQAKGNK
ncbi:xanthine dehydrogenase family protein subunit M [Ramlibacter tataouinensis]|uniref:FAD binding domain-containing protein n=1 Tax=Ramlibacter tataouinensis TaxID=94132 RepID=UPI0022F3F545|nr:xanthine dehydrogenase family protein subunit M [Ramlibacter tataouinensis]WBY00546.1 xanthine dehydrogenase family protein subunit M [Ramlibacter tataouinensis]